MNHTPQIRKVEITGPLQITLEWSTGETYVTDLSGTIGPKREGDPFAVLHNLAIFAQAQSDDWGDGLSWPSGLDLGADLLYSLNQAAQAIGMTRRMIAYYKSGARQIPKTVWLACIGYESLRNEAA